MKRLVIIVFIAHAVTSCTLEPSQTEVVLSSLLIEQKLAELETSNKYIVERMEGSRFRRENYELLQAIIELRRKYQAAPSLQHLASYADAVIQFDSSFAEEHLIYARKKLESPLWWSNPAHEVFLIECLDLEGRIHDEVVRSTFPSDCRFFPGVLHYAVAGEKILVVVPAKLSDSLAIEIRNDATGELLSFDKARSAGFATLVSPSFSGKTYTVSGSVHEDGFPIYFEPLKIQM